ncbi:hypothetical protein V6U89_03880 [Micromonospora sp. CPCC 206171]|uniref:hypothetical protein n=1 Tax=Micromonospora sp. CPCC 206171 TaxID=3122405 RepID=UPI002FEFA4D8
MGASGWSYSVAYQPDVAAALRQLRQDVYDRGEYYREEPDPTHALAEDEFRATLDPAHDDSGINEFLLNDWQAAQRRPRPVDPDSLLAAQPYSGTHSVIDMVDGVSDEPTACTVSPLTGEQLLAYFGTVHPAPDQVLAWMKSFDPYPIRERWEGVYVVSYVDGHPDQIHFTGFSGD